MEENRIDYVKKKIWNPLPQEKLDELLSSFVEIQLDNSQDKNYFNLIRETLQRIGVLKNGKLYQTAHILYKRNKYYIVHFKQLFELDGRCASMDDIDKQRLVKIAYLICKKWKLANAVNESIFDGMTENSGIFVHIVKHSDIAEGKVELHPKYKI